MAKPRSTEPKPGDLIGRKYAVERVIGQGGMGLVLQARHVELDQRVAIKVLPDSQAADDEVVRRFMREAQAAARLKSEHAVKVIDVGRPSRRGAPYIVMELLEGEDLGSVVGRGPLPIQDAVAYVLQACEAVAEAHSLRIVHRDLKPRNLFLSRSRVGDRPIVKVLDFGLAKRIAVQDVTLTATSAVMGSPQYMSPEQMKASRDVDLRTDIWSLGVCLYELTSGRVPFDADAVPVLCAMVLKEPAPPVRTRRPDVPPGLEAVIMRCLAKDPDERFANVSELADALEPFAPAYARGAAARVATVLFATAHTGSDGAPASLGPLDVAAQAGGERIDTRTAATFDSAPISSQRGTSEKYFIAGGIVFGTLAIAGAALTWVALHRPAGARGAGSDDSAAAAASATADERSGRAVAGGVKEIAYTSRPSLAPRRPNGARDGESGAGPKGESAPGAAGTSAAGGARPIARPTAAPEPPPAHATTPAHTTTPAHAPPAPTPPRASPQPPARVDPASHM